MSELGNILPARDITQSAYRERYRHADTPNSTTATFAATGVSWARHFRRQLLVSDSVVIIVAVASSLVARFALAAGPAGGSGITAEYAGIAVVIAGAWMVMLAAYHSRDARVIGVGLAEYKSVVNASSLTFGLLAIGFLVFQVPIARGFFIVALPAGLGGLLLERWLWRRWLNHNRGEGHYLSRAIVVGEASDVSYVVRQIDKKSGAAYNVVGVALPSNERLPMQFAKHSVPVVSDLESVGAAVRNMGADAVIVAGEPAGRGHYIRDLGWELEGTGAELVVASSLTNVAGPRIHFRPVEGLPLMHVELPQFEGGKHLLKRIFDVTMSGLALLALFPVFAIIALAIRRDSEGPVLFRQERVGRNGKTFKMLKFRSMVQTAETDLAMLLDKNEGSGPLFKLKNDPRVTKVGQVLRRFSLDELPQFWNVFTGEMSLVGPRPPLQTEVEDYERHVHRRLYIKPGLTGMWQVNGRSDLSWEESVRLDLYYVENWSLTGDLIILWRTLRVFARPVGAY
ncbi:sugar transferase [Lacisediminihabitans profunda]|uniref:Sugar transferase n=1 Tax=Lacisediminihabitans profunda TaxID=2594790 RepID=A0A5C8UPS0_9MICO|nr:sugar transferase [Lacisediminihabitans profunda]TXN30422.1 sugar transferase [Lacisediminihabitans profunda]